MTPATTRSLESPQAYVAVFLLAIAALAVRMPERLRHGFIWAEDIVVFVKDAIEQGVPTLWTPYAGYHVLMSRVLALIQSVFPLQWAPYMLAWENAAIIAMCAAYLFGFWWRLTGGLPLHASMRNALGLVFALAPLLVPHLGEAFLSIANQQWILSAIFLVLLLDVLYLSPGGSVAGLVVRTTVLAALALTGPFVLVFAPIWIPLAAWSLKTRAPLAWLPTLVLLAAAALQLASIAMGGRMPGSWNLPWSRQFGANFLAEFFFGNRFFESLKATWPLASLALIVALVAGIRAVSPRLRIALAALIVGAALVWIAGASRVNAQSPDLLPNILRYRYGLPAGILLLWSLTLLVVADPRRRSLWAVLLALPIFATAMQFSVDSWPMWTITEDAATGVAQITTPPDWTTSIRTHPPRLGGAIPRP